VGSSWLGAALALKQGLGLLQDVLLPLADLHRVDAIVLPDLIDGLEPSHGLKPHFGFELRQVDVALFCFSHDDPISDDGVSLNFCLKNGGHFTRHCRRQSIYQLTHRGVAVEGQILMLDAAPNVFPQKCCPQSHTSSCKNDTKAYTSSPPPHALQILRNLIRLEPCHRLLIAFLSASATIKKRL
jgi:hypothetical protein